MTDDTQTTLVSIGELARRTGLAVRTLRFYCDEGILDACRSVGGHRLFEARTAVERVLLIKRLRALGLGLASITEVLRRERSIAEAVAEESARLDVEMRTLAWRRASLRAVEAASPTGRAERLALLAAAQDGGSAHESLVRFWLGTLAPIPPDDVEGWIGWNVPRPPIDPSVEEVVAYAALVAMVSDPALKVIVRQQYWRGRAELVRDPRELYGRIGDVMADVVPLVSAGVRPSGGRELDRFVDAHAGARGECDTPRFRARLLDEATDGDQRIHRYWTLTEQLLGARITVGRAHDWVYRALVDSLGR
ncbi:MerR family transcriptional regulator [Nocardia caishijiensis]|uniref:MerR family transcriptional regulator n=1 Tax=Nocardia caishijiensis TaxID=184756 RepID=UPI001916FB58|nr:MerR family transcriptional regulator [Nocardia caishijiensis]